MLKKITQEELGSIIRVSRQTINAIEKEKFDPSLPTTFLISQLFELPIEKIFFFEKSKESEKQDSTWNLVQANNSWLTWWHTILNEQNKYNK